MVTVDVVIPSYNRLNLLMLSLNSVLSQTYKPNNIYVVDDKSDFLINDFYKKLIKLEMSKINVQFIRNETNLGACYSRNKGTSLSNSSYIAFLDDDDLWEPDHLKNLIKSIETNRTVMAYSGKKIRIFESGMERIAYKRIPESDQFLALIKYAYVGSTSCVLIKREVLLKVGGFDESLPAIQDYDLYLRISKVGKISSSSEPTLIYRADTPCKISNIINNSVKAANIILSKYSGDTRKVLNHTFTYQNIKKSVKYKSVSGLFSVIINFLRINWLIGMK